jgi:hypothetical protein
MVSERRQRRLGSGREGHIQHTMIVCVKRDLLYLPATVWSLLCVAETRATRPNGEWGYSSRRQCWAECPAAVSPEEALYLPTFSHLFDCH